MINEKNKDDEKVVNVPAVDVQAAEKSAPAIPPQKPADDANKSRGFRGKKRLRSGQEEPETPEEADAAGLAKAKESNEFVEKVISINRITKVTKGGKKLSFSALVVVGDSKGHVGYGLEKAAEVSIAIKKAVGAAKRNMISVHLKGSTITHEIIGECGGARVLLKPALDGTGVIAAGPVRAVCDGVGIRNILSKCHRSNNPINVVKATFDGLQRLKAHIN